MDYSIHYLGKKKKIINNCGVQVDCAQLILCIPATSYRHKYRITLSIKAWRDDSQLTRWLPRHKLIREVIRLKHNNTFREFEKKLGTIKKKRQSQSYQEGGKHLIKHITLKLIWRKLTIMEEIYYFSLDNNRFSLYRSTFIRCA